MASAIAAFVSLISRARSNLSRTTAEILDESSKATFLPRFPEIPISETISSTHAGLIGEVLPVGVFDKMGLSCALGFAVFGAQGFPVESVWSDRLSACSFCVFMR